MDTRGQRRCLTASKQKKEVNPTKRNIPLPAPVCILLLLAACSGKPAPTEAAIAAAWKDNASITADGNYICLAVFMNGVSIPAEFMLP